MNMKRTLGLVAATALASAAFVSQAEADPVITVEPANQNVAAGGTATVDIDVSGLTQGVGGIQFDLGFASSLLTGDSYKIDPAGAMGGPYNAANDFSNGFGKDVNGNAFSGVDIVYLASATAPLDAEGTGFTLATVTFTASTVNSGISQLTLSDFALSEADGATTIGGVTAVDGQICVGGNCGVQSAPEIDPAGALSAMTLLVGGLVLVRGRRIQKVDAA